MRGAEGRIANVLGTINPAAQIVRQIRGDGFSWWRLEAAQPVPP
jgi:hypothetical protein